MDSNITIIGAGVIGLAIASELSKVHENILVIEKNSAHGLEISSRNSEVIHSAVNYPTNSLKSKLCLEGNKLIYEKCSKNNIPYKKIGKLIISQDKDGINELERKLEQAELNGVKNISLISKNRLNRLEPYINAELAIFSEDTGIINSHSFMDYLYFRAKENKVDFAFQHEILNIEKNTHNYKIKVKQNNEFYDFTTEILINAAGLNADKISSMCGFNYKHHYCKGDYFSVHNGKNKLVSRLVYPIVRNDSHGLGIHITLDLNGRMKLGPDAYYIGEINYRIDENKKIFFHDAVKKYFPPLELEDLLPDISGIRPKLQTGGESFKDFYINQDLPGFINLLGIESPGFTSSLAIANYVRDLLK